MNYPSIMSNAAADEVIRFKDLEQAPGPRLAQIVDLIAVAGVGAAPDQSGLWGPEELGLILHEYLDTPLRNEGNEDGSGGPSSFGEVLRDAAPPLRLLERLREVGESGRAGADGLLPPEVASLLYFTAAAAALARHGRRIIGSEDAALMRGMSWAADLAWVDESCRAVLRAGLAALAASGSRQGSGSWSEETADSGGDPSGSGAGVFDLARAGVPACINELGCRPLPEIPHVTGYQVTGRLGEGGMGVVWRAVQVATRREVALKVLAGGSFGSSRGRQRFEREVELAARLNHPHVARVFDSGTLAGQCYYAMELVEGLHLDLYVREMKLTDRQVVALMADVCRAVQHAHQRGVIHRDLKPSNILVTTDGQPKVLDFGLAKAIGEAQAGTDLTLTQEGLAAGTPAYMSPEQARGELDKLDTRTDVYSLGATLYLLLTGRHPHDMAGSRHDVLRRVGTADVRRPRHLRPDLDRELEAVLLKALAHEPADRYASVGELAADLDRYLTGEPLAARPPTLPYLLRKRLRRHWLPVSVTIGFAVALLGTGGYFYAREVGQRHAAQQSAHQEREAKDAAVGEKRRAELALADARVAEGDALILTDGVGEAKARYQEAIDTLLRNGESAFMAELALWDAHRRSPPPLMEFIGHTDTVNCAVFLPDGRRVLTGSQDGTVRLWDALTGRTLRVFSGVGKVQKVAVRSDGQLAAFAATGLGDGRGLTLWEPGTGRRVGELVGFDGEPMAVAYAPDDRHLLVGTSGKERNACLIDVASGSLVRVFAGHTGIVRAVAMAPSGLLAFTAAASRPQRGREQAVSDPTVRGWGVASGRQLWEGKGNTGKYIADVAASSDGRLVATAAWERTGVFWDARTGRRQNGEGAAIAGHGGGVAFSPGGVLAAVAGAEGIVDVVTPGSGTAIAGRHGKRTLFFGGDKAVSFSPDGRFVMAALGNVARVWPLAEPAALRPFINAGAMHKRRSIVPGASKGVSFSPDGRLALSTEDDTPPRAVLWDVSTGMELAAAVSSSPSAAFPNEGTATGHRAAFLPDGQSVLLADARGAAVVRNLSLGRDLRRLEPCGDLIAATVATSSDGRRAMVRYWGNDQLHLYDLSTGRRLCQLTLGGRVNWFVFSPDARLATAITATTNTAVAWDAESGQELHRWAAPTGARSVAFSGDGRTMVVAGERDAMLLDVGNGATFRFPASTAELRAAVPSPDGRGVVGCTVGGDGLRVWDRTTGRDRFVPLDSDNVMHCAFSPAGDQLLVPSVGAGHYLQLLDLGLTAAVREHGREMARHAELPPDLPDDPGLLLRLGRWYARRGVWNYALELLGRARAGGADVPEAEIARCLWMSGDAPAAVAAYGRAIAGAPDGAERDYLMMCCRAAVLADPGLEAFARAAAAAHPAAAAAAAPFVSVRRTPATSYSYYSHPYVLFGLR